MKKFIFAIAIIICTISVCNAQHYYRYYPYRTYYHYHSSGYADMTLSANEWDLKTDSIPNINTMDTTLIVNGVECDIAVYPIKSVSNTYGQIKLPKWVKILIYKDIENGKHGTNYLVDEFYTHTGENSVNEYLVRIFSYDGSYERNVKMFGYGCHTRWLKIGDYNGFMDKDWKKDKFSIKGLILKTDEEKTAIYNYIEANQQRLGIKLLSKRFDRYGDLEVEYYLLDIWKEEVRQIDNVIKNGKLQTIN